MKTKVLLLLMMIVFQVQQAEAINTNDSLSENVTGEPNQINLYQPPKAFTTEATYIGDVCTNLYGGIKTGVLFLGMANLKLGFDTPNAKLWRGGHFFINGAATHGKSPSELMVGDFQTVSNIDAGDHIYIHELWYKHQFNRFEITYGLQDLNIEFAGSDNGGMFINSSFGIPPVISDNIPAPVFPLTALGITTKIQIAKKVSLSAAIYDGCPTAFEHNVYNTNWHLYTEDGYLILGELDWLTELFQLPGTYKAGYYFHSGLMETDPETGEMTEVFDKNYGVYFIADQTVWKKTNSDQGIGVFAQLALSPANINNHHYYIGGGINYFGISTKQLADAFGMAVAYAGFNKSLMKNETTIEAFYKKQVGENFFVQPDLQYVIHPAGTDKILQNSLVGLLRFSFSF